MNKKVLVIIILALALIPAVTAAQLMEGAKDVLAKALNVSENIDLVWIKAGFLIVVFFLIFGSAQKIMPHNRAGMAILSMIISLIGIRYMPEEWISWMGASAVYLLGIVVLLIPYFLGRYFFGSLIFRCGRGGKLFLVLLCYAAAIFFATRFEGFKLEHETWGMLSLAIDWILANKIVALVIIAILLFSYIISSGRAVPPSMAGPRPGFFRQLGSGAWGAAKGGAWGTGWLAGRAARKMRAIGRARSIARIRAARQAAQLKKKINLIGTPPAKMGFLARRRAARQAKLQEIARSERKRVAQQVAQQRYKPSMRINVIGKRPEKPGLFEKIRYAVMGKHYAKKSREMDQKLQQMRAQTLAQATKSAGRSGKEVENILKKYKKRFKNP